MVLHEHSQTLFSLVGRSVNMRKQGEALFDRMNSR
jgi:hypothetical protein